MQETIIQSEFWSLRFPCSLKIWEQVDWSFFFFYMILQIESMEMYNILSVVKMDEPYFKSVMKGYNVNVKK